MTLFSQKLNHTKIHPTPVLAPATETSSLASNWSWKPTKSGERGQNSPKGTYSRSCVKTAIECNSYDYPVMQLKPICQRSWQFTMPPFPTAWWQHLDLEPGVRRKSFSCWFSNTQLPPSILGNGSRTVDVAVSFQSFYYERSAYQATTVEISIYVAPAYRRRGGTATPITGTAKAPAWVLKHRFIFFAHNKPSLAPDIGLSTLGVFCPKWQNLTALGERP